MFFFKRHLFHLVNKSPWPLFVGIFLFFVTSGLVFFFHRITLGGFVFLFGLIGLSLVVFFWFRDVCEEATFLGYHTLVVRKGMIKGFFLFIASEFMLFFGFFWAFFHASLSPAFIFAGEWPQPGIVAVFPLGFPFFNTLLLIISGVVVTMVHRAIALVLLQSV
jgi:cytochrome c oxidase subunit 3